MFLRNVLKRYFDYIIFNYLILTGYMHFYHFFVICMYLFYLRKEGPQAHEIFLIIC
jgi:hypothetical protein